MQKMSMLKKVCFVGGLLLLAWVIYSHSLLYDYLSLAYIKEQSFHFKQLVNHYYWLSVGLYVLFFALIIALSIPASIVLTLLGGYLFGVIYGAVYATLAVVIGVTVAYMALQLFFKHMFNEQEEKLRVIAESIRSYGVSYLLVLHFSAVFPYFIINSCAAFAHMSVLTVMWTSLVGFLPQAFIYAFAGQELSSIEHVQDIFSREIIIALGLLMLLACVPMVVKKFKTKMFN